MNRRIAITITVIVAVLFGVFFIFPAAIVLGEAFWSKDTGFTLAFVGEVFSNPVYLEGLRNAFMLGVTSTLASLLIAFPLALLAHRYRFPFKGTLGALILIPLVLPPFVGAVGVKQMLGVKGALNAFLVDLGLMDAGAPVDWLGEGRFWGVVIMNALHLYPILYMNVAAALSHLDPAMEQAAQNLGCPPWKRLWRITLPLTMPGIFAGGAIVFIWSFTELGVPLVFDYTRVAPVQVYDGIKDLGSNPFPYALVAVMLVVSAGVFLISKKLLGRSGLGMTPRPKGRQNEVELRGVKGFLCSGVFLLVLVVASVPHLGVILSSVSGDWYGTILPSSFTGEHYREALGHPLVVPSIKNSLLYASGSTLIDIVLGLMIAWVVVRSDIKGRSLLDALVMLPLAVPGLVLAFGFLALSQEGRVFHFLVGTAENPALLLVVAYAVRRLPYVVRAAVAGLQQSNIALEEAALSLGATPARMMRRVALPLLGANVVAGGILAFAFAMLEVSDSLILAQQAEHFPITKAIYSLLGTLGNGHELAAALGVWAMVFLSISIIGAVVLGGKKGGLFRM
ncbi:MAG: iron ABC transporter permease [Akkermansiaceae bacterium]|nr:iron ABC transporter permease [Akkermansiaceae bacterium]